MTPQFASSHPPLPAFQSNRFRIELMRPEFNRPDWDAVMSSRESLRIWSDSSWPEDDFTLEQNLSDMKAHLGDHAAGEAYAYSVFNSDGSLCLGSIYVKPIAVMEAYWNPDPKLREVLPRLATRTDFWLRDSEALQGGDEAMVSTILDWVGQSWIGGVAFSLRPGMERRRKAYLAAGLRSLGSAASRETTQTIEMFGL